jgi:hypothetical protein
MSDNRAGFFKLATLQLVRDGLGDPTLEPAGDAFLSHAEILRMVPESIPTSGEPLTCTRIDLKGGGSIRTAAAVETDILPIVEAAQAEAASAELQPLVDRLEARTVQEQQP